MTHARHTGLPKCWQRPSKDCQPTFFSEPVEEMLAELRVSRDDLRRWKQQGWLSFDVDAADRIDLPQEKEIRFLRHLVLAGLGICQIERLLTGLPMPYCYDLDSTAYHYAHGWVTPATEKPFDVVDAQVEEWLSHLADNGDVGRLKELADEIAEHIESMEKADEETDEVDEG